MDEAATLTEDIRVVSAFACEGISHDAQGNVYIHRLIDHLSSHVFPATSLALTVLFGFQRRLPGFLMECHADIVPEVGEPIASVKIPDLIFPPNQATTRHIIVFSVIHWPRPGQYTVRLWSRGTLVASFVIPLLQPIPMGVAQSA